MAKFCVKCGARLDETTKLCPNCSPKPEKLQEQNVSRNVQKYNGNQKAIEGTRKKGRGLLFLFVAIVCLVGIGAALGALAYFEILNVPFISEYIETNKAKKDIIITLDALLGRSEESDSYILGSFVLAGTSNKIFTDNEISKKIANQVVYSVSEIEINKPDGAVIIEITAPDVQLMLNDAMQDISALDNVDTLLDFVVLKLDGEYPIINESFKCEIKYTLGNWYLIPNAELFDAMSGKLYSFYNDLIEQMLDEMESIAGGTDNVN